MKNLIGRIISSVICIAVMLTAFPVGGYRVSGAEKYPPNTAVIRLNASQPEGTGFETVECGTKNEPTIVERAGQKAWLLDKTNSAKQTIGVVLEPNFKHGEFDGSEYDIEIDYYDVIKGYFILHYDEHIVRFDQYAGITMMEGTSLWKTARYTLNNAAFKKGVDGKYDFRITICEPNSRDHKVSDSSIPIKEIRVIKKPQKNAVYVATETRLPGNIYKWFEKSKILYNTFENLTDKEQKVTVEHKITDLEGLVLFTKTEEMTLAAKEKKEHQLEFGEVTRCGMLDYFVSVKNSDGSIDSMIRPMRITVVKSDPNGILNDRMYWNVGIDRAVERRAEVADYNEALKRTDDALELIKTNNSIGVRHGIGWEHLDKNGIMSWENSIKAEMFKGIRAKGMKYMPICQAGHHTLTPALRTVARTEEEIQRLEQFLEWIASEIGDIVDVWEMFNEPNITSFNTYVNDWADGAHIMMLTDKMAAAVKKGDPDSTVFGLCVCAMMNKESQKFFKAAVDTGLMDDNLDGFSFHPYISHDPETYRSYDGEPTDEMIYNNYIKVMENAGINNFPCFDSEIGYTPGDAKVDSMIDAAQKLIRYLIYMDARELVEGHAIHTLSSRSDIVYGREDTFGAMYGWEDGQKRYGAHMTSREIYPAVTAYNYLMTDFSVEKCMDDPEKNVWLTKFNSHKFGKDIVTLTSVDTSKLVTLRLNTDKVTVFDWLGNETEAYGKDGVFTFNSNERIIYIMGDIGEVEILDEKPLFDTDEPVISVAQGDMMEIRIENNSGVDCTYNVTVPQCASVLEIKKETKGSEIATILFENNAELGKEYTLTVDAVDGNGKRLTSIYFVIKSTASAIPSLKIVRGDSSDINNWVGVLNIKNTSMNKALKGKISFNNPSDLATMRPADIGIITAGREGEVTISLPPIKKKGRQFAAFELLLDNGEIVRGSQQYETAMAVYAHKKPQIDGVLDKGEWNMDGAMYADTVEQVVNIVDWNGVEDISGRSVVEWDEENFYMMAEVTDNIFYQTETIQNSWQGDGIQFGVSAFDTGYSPLGEVGTTFHEMNIALCPDGAQVYRSRSQEGGGYENGLVDAATLAIKRNGNKTVYEFMIPWEKFINPGQTVGEGNEIKYSFLINDNDGTGRRGWIECGSGIGLGKDMRLFMTMTLVK